MGNTSTQTKSSQSATATPQEQQLEGNEMAVSNANLPNQLSINNNSAALINSILTGSYAGPAAGVSNDQTQSMVNASLRDIAPQFQTSGILNSGEAAQVAGRTAMDTRNANAQFNVEAGQNLLSAGLGGGTNWSASNNQNNSTTGSQLAGLRNISSNSTVTQNPFLNSFYSSLGSLPADVAKAGLAAVPGGGAFSSAIGSSKL